MAQRLIYFNSRDSLLRLDISKITYFEGDGNYTYLITTNKMKACLSMNLAHTEEALANQLGEQANRFMRIGKRYIVNMEYIFKVDILKQRLVLSDNLNFIYQLDISKEALKNVKELIVKTRI